jgi:acyl dehydratase
MTAPAADYPEVVTVGRDAVDSATIRTFCEAIGDTNPIYLDDDAARAHGHPAQVVPPALLHAWTMPPLPLRGNGSVVPGTDDLAGTTIIEQVRQDLIAAGYDAVVATDYEHDYVRYLTVGDWITERSSLETISEPKQTRLGLGRFVTTLHRFFDAHDELVGTQRLRVLVFPRRSAASAPRHVEAGSSHPMPARGDDAWPALEISVTATIVTCAAIASNDFNPVHHDRDLAQSQGLPDIIMNILASCGLASRYVTDRFGPATRIRALRLRLGIPNHPGDRLVLTGAPGPANKSGAREIDVVGTNARGAHITATVLADLGAAEPKEYTA